VVCPLSKLLEDASSHVRLIPLGSDEEIDSEEYGVPFKYDREESGEGEEDEEEGGQEDGDSDEINSDELGGSGDEEGSFDGEEGSDIGSDDDMEGSDDDEEGSDMEGSDDDMDGPQESYESFPSDEESEELPMPVAKKQKTSGKSEQETFKKGTTVILCLT